ncbi:MAG: HNH endonuclease, partial [Bacteroidales bacterium]|nr:HNH endonuclease [Bacteroidales bacterium]
PNTGRFQKGIVPYSKGKKRAEYMSAEAIEKCVNTQFKKGNKPHSTLPVGTEMVISGYVYVKVAEEAKAKKYVNWKPKHRLLWESVNGPIPEGCNIQFKDGNPKNIVIDNLYMISREEQMKANSIVNLPDDARELLKAIARLTREINKREKYEQESKC